MSAQKQKEALDEQPRRRGLKMADFRQLEVSVEIPGTEDEAGAPAVVTFVCERLDVGRAAELETLQASMKAAGTDAGALLLEQMARVVVDVRGLDELPGHRVGETDEAYRERFRDYFKEVGAGAELVVGAAVGFYFELQAPRSTFRHVPR